MLPTPTDAVLAQWQDVAESGGYDRLERLWGQQGPQHVAIIHAFRVLRPQSVLEIGSSVGLNLAGPADSIPVCGVDSDAGAMAFAARLIPGIFITGDVRAVLPALARESWDVSLSCYTLAYIAPEDIDRVLDHLVRVTRRALVLAEPDDGVVGTPPLWSHAYETLLPQRGLRLRHIEVIPEIEGLSRVATWEVRHA